MRRRALLHGSGAAAALLWSPFSRARRSGGHDAYFTRLNSALKQYGPGRPVLLLDRDRMDRNVKRLTNSVGKQKNYRVVVKSLPSVSLLKHVTERAKTRSLMVFHQPFLNEVASAFGEADVLLGKPMPVVAARTFYQRFKRSGHVAFDPSRQIQWLIDSRQRLQQYQALARQLGVQMRVNFEIDVGLRRGGLTTAQELASLLTVVAADPQHLQLGGLMGYEAHLTGLSADLQHPAVVQVLETYRSFVEQLQRAGYAPEQLTLNGAGSHTLKIYEGDHTMNDLAAGSGVVMPTDFDTHHLAGHEPAMFIATPILKRYPGNPLMSEPPENMRRLYYIYGGYWKAEMVSPTAVGEAIYRSTNQSPVATAESVELEVDDYMFLRPTQSEFVMLQFGDIIVVEGGRLGSQWPVFQQTG